MYEFLVGLEVTDNAVYTQYREAMKPLLSFHGGSFGYDFVVSEVLLSQVDVPINRVFTINFPNQATADEFFSNDEYLQVKERYFNESVQNTTIIASYEKTPS
ncbi:DUF1330 domain-containing protein [Vibrio kyushuensis]|uniref:DUF1330 domain-containing protein n=1 Tax=Vibrio kyushuensis TaxID=2910249 RepID=UPI003D11364D